MRRKNPNIRRNGRSRKKGLILPLSAIILALLAGYSLKRNAGVSDELSGQSTPGIHVQTEAPDEEKSGDTPISPEKNAAGTSQQQEKTESTLAPGDALNITYETETQTDAEGNHICTENVRDYRKLNLATLDQDYMSGSISDIYGEGRVRLVPVTEDSTYLDLDDQEQLSRYTVLSQMPAPGTPIRLTVDPDGNSVHSTYDEIVLRVRKSGADAENHSVSEDKDAAGPGAETAADAAGPGAETAADAAGPLSGNEAVPALTEILPSPDISHYYVRDYQGRNLAGVIEKHRVIDTRDYYGPELPVELKFVDETGSLFDLSDTVNQEQITRYKIIGQIPAPNQEILVRYSKDEDGKRRIAGSSVSQIQLVIRLTDSGKAESESESEMQKQLRSAGDMQNLQNGLYQIGKDLEEGKYSFHFLDNDSYVKVYQNQEKLDRKTGAQSCRSYDYIGDRAILKKGMILEVGHVPEGHKGPEATRTDLTDEEKKQEILYPGRYLAGKELSAGRYQMAPVKWSGISIYKSEKDYDAYIEQHEKGKKGKKPEYSSYYLLSNEMEQVTLKKGMVVVVGDGPAIFSRS